ncbi:MAG: tRNA (adenosine(37)-N6)-dimethylallyltransferase MiaA [Bacteroidales bacterium]|nr:tRNA (adenosine(37)-N6)-dimethylallyltransferase MiaA [Bacteroidales bacterium]
MNYLIVILGPTGIGKTALSLQISERFSAPILSADSRQLFKELPIGTAAPTPEEQNRVKHYFVGKLSLSDYYSASIFENEVLSLLNELYKKNPVAVLSGGSMLYIDAVCNGIDDLPTVDISLRNELMERLKTEGLDQLRNELRILDPEYYNEVDLKNAKRILHALEICLMTGKPFSSFRSKTKKERPFKIIKIGLKREREELYDRINRRVDEMITTGLIEEARNVYPQKGINSLNTVGYKELFNYFDGIWDLDFAIEKIKQNSRIYSRKQMTWFKRDPEINWFHPDDIDGIFTFLSQSVIS